MLLTIFLALVFCAAVSIVMIAMVGFIQNEKFFSSAPKEAQELIKPRSEELFYGARTMGWVLMAISLLLIICIGVISIWDGFKNDYSFWQFFLRFTVIFTIYKVFDMTFIDWFLLCKSHFFQFFYPEVEPVFNGRKYGFNIKSQLLKLLVIFPAASALAAWICTLF